MRQSRLIFLVVSSMVVIISAVLIIQVIYMSRILTIGQLPSMHYVNAVIVYGGKQERTLAGFCKVKDVGARWIVLSGTDKEVGHQDNQRKENKAEGYSTIIINGVYTTDQNARTTIPVLKELGARSAMLVTSWYHMPRAYLLTRLYSIGSGIEWSFAPADQVPAGYWKRRELWIELFKFWGSLGRVVLAWFGIASRG